MQRCGAGSSAGRKNGCRACMAVPEVAIMGGHARRFVAATQTGATVDAARPVSYMASALR